MVSDHPERCLYLPVGKGVCLRELGQDDAPAYFRLVESSREHLARWLQWVAYISDVQDCTVAIREFQESNTSSGGLTLGVFAGGSIAGVVSLLGIDQTNERASMAYWLGTSFLKRGLMTASCLALLEYAFSTLRLHRIELSAAVENVESWRLAERLSFQLEGVQRESERLHGNFLDHRLYGLLEREWASREKRSIYLIG